MVLGLALVLPPLAARPAAGQLAVNRSSERVLFLVPQPQGGLDTAYAVELAEQVRRRLSTQMRHKLVVITDDQICQALTASGYPCDAILTAADADRLAGFLQADAYLFGRVWEQQSRPMARFRLVDNSRTSGLSGWTTVNGAAGDPPRAFAETIVDTLENQVRAAEYARECQERRNRGDFGDALERARRAYGMYPNHPSAALCAWVSSEAMGQPVDSQVRHLQRAVAGDSLNARAWERLGRAIQLTGDTLAALEAFVQQTLLQPNDRERRVGVILGAVSMGQFETAVNLADEWIERNPLDTEMVQIKLSACVEGEMWSCALATNEELGERDSTLLADSTYFQSMIGYAQSAGNIGAQLQWSYRGAARFPMSQSLLRAHAGALVALGMTDSVLSMYDRLLEIDSTDIRTSLAGAELLLADMTIRPDSIAPLDTAALLKGADYLRLLTAATQDTSVLLRAAVLYFSRGRELVSTSQLIPTAVEFLEHALRHDLQGRLAEQANFFLAYALVLRVFEFDREVIAAESCELVDEEAEMIQRGLEALQVGFDVAPEYAQRFRDQLQSFRDRIPQLRRAYSCS